MNKVNRSQREPIRAWLLFGIVAALLVVSVAGAFFVDTPLAWTVGFAYIIYDTGLLLYIAWVTRRIDQNPAAVSQTSYPICANAQARSASSAVPTVAALVPIYNEQSAVVDTVEHLLAQSQPLTQIIIIDDGSTDASLERLEQRFGFNGLRKSTEPQALLQSQREANVFLLKKPNSGKASSLNLALKQVEADITMTVDADTLLAPEAIAAFVQAFSADRDLVAAGGVLTPKARGRGFARLLNAFQFFEYALSYLSRAAWGQTNALLLVSGAFAAYRTDALKQVGGFDANSLVEDYELTHRLHEYSSQHGLNWQVATLAAAQGSTDAPATVSAFIQQRKRWFAGFLRTHHQYRHMIAQGQYQSVGRFMMPIKTIDTLQPIYGLLALLVLAGLLLSSHHVSAVILWAIAAKLVIDYLYHIWALRKYLRWIRQPISLKLWAQMTGCVLLAPLLFQPLRQFSALVGWSMIGDRSAKWQPIRADIVDN